MQALLPSPTKQLVLVWIIYEIWVGLESLPINIFLDGQIRAGFPQKPFPAGGKTVRMTE
jgi:hypothetical protein